VKTIDQVRGFHRNKSNSIKGSFLCSSHSFLLIRSGWLTKINYMALGSILQLTSPELVLMGKS